MSEPTKHHYIPKFLLAEWAVNKGKLWRFTRPYGKKIDQKLVAPAAIGYEDRLYTTSGLPDRYAQQFEKAFLSKVCRATTTMSACASTRMSGGAGLAGGLRA